MKRRKRPSASATPPEVSNQNLQPGAASPPTRLNAFELLSQLHCPDDGPVVSRPALGVPHQRVCISKLFSFLPGNIYLVADGSIEEVDPMGQSHKLVFALNSNGKPYLFFTHLTSQPFRLWLSRAFYEAFWGRVPDGFEVYHIDGETRNLAIENLDIRPRTDSGYRLTPPSDPWAPFSWL